MADKEQDSPDKKGLKGVKAKLSDAFGTGKDNPSIPVILGQELKRPFKRLEGMDIGMLGFVGVMGSVLLALPAGGIGSGVYWGTEPAQDTQISAAADASYAHAAVTLRGQSYLLIRDGSDYRVFKQDRDDNRFEYVGQPVEAIAVLEHVNQQFAGIIDYTRQGRSLSGYTIPEMVVVSGLSIAVEEGGSDIYRYYDAIADKPRTQGLSYPDDLEQFSQIWRQAQEAINTNGYGFTAEGRAAVADRGTEDDFIANGAIIGGLVPLLGLLGVVGIGGTARTRRRVKSFRERGHDDYSLR